MEQLEEIGNQFIEAAVSDFSRPETVQAIKDSAITIASRITGYNLNTALLRPIIESAMDKKIDQAKGYVMQHVGLALSNPPDSIDATAEVVKEEVGGKVSL
jgi:hypothetical protein